METSVFENEMEAKRFIKNNWEYIFYRPRQYRLNLDSITNVEIEILRYGANHLDFLLMLEIKVMNETKNLQFFESVLIKENTNPGDIVLGKISINDVDKVIVDAFSNSEYMESMINNWSDKRKIGNLIMLGTMVKELEEIKVIKIQSLYNTHPSTNYTYILHLASKSTDNQKAMFVKRFTPRSPINRGNREHKMLMTIQNLNITPKVYGALATRTHKYECDHPLILVIFSEFLKNTEEVGARIWHEMKILSQNMNKNRKNGLIDFVKTCIQKVIIPFHTLTFQKWHSELKFAVEGSSCYNEFFTELQENLSVLVQNRLLSENEISSIQESFYRIWNDCLLYVPLTEIHHDLMWKQIIIDQMNKYYLLDLDEHITCHAGKDLADLMAANRFIAEKLIHTMNEQKKVECRKLAEEINDIIVTSYENMIGGFSKGPWLKDLKLVCLGYLTFRHLHDAAYFAPIRENNPDHSHSTDFSINLFKNSLKTLDSELKSRKT